MRKVPGVTLTASPASGVPRVCSACFIRMPGTLEMPPEGKSGGTLNMISTVWVAGSPLSVLRRSDQVMASLRSGTSTSARNRKLGRLSRAGRHGLGPPDRRTDEAFAVGVGGVLLVEHHPLRGPSLGARCERRWRLLAWLETAHAYGRHHAYGRRCRPDHKGRFVARQEIANGRQLWQRLGAHGRGHCQRTQLAGSDVLACRGRGGDARRQLSAD